MTANRANADSKQREVYDLADALLSDAITAAQARRLDELVCNDAEARRHWLKFVYDAAMLREWSSVGAEPMPAAEDGGRRAGSADRSTRRAFAGWTISPWPPAALFGSLPLGYVAAAIVLCVAVLAAWCCNVPDSGWHAMGPIARASGVEWRRVGDAATRGRSVIAGEITEMAGCRWGDRGGAAPWDKDVAVGRAFDLRSGRLTIHFNGGDAKVTLEGPAEFQVIALRTGFLASGRLSCRTGLVHAPGGLAHPSGFGIRTPSCLMRDRGAEISVAVDQSGASLWQLSRGQVDLWYPKGCMPKDGIRVGPRGRREGWVYWSSGDDKYRPGLRLLFGVGQPPLGLATLAYKDRSKELKSAGGPLWLDGLRRGNHPGDSHDGIGLP